MALFNKQELASKISIKFKNNELITSFIEVRRLQFKQTAENKSYDIFLSHRFLDWCEILILKEEIEQISGYSVYVAGIEDEELSSEKITKETALILKKRMQNCRSLMYAFSENSKESKWMPWELGYFDGLKDKACIIPITEFPTDNNVFKGQEYLGVYPYISKDKDSWGRLKLWINNSEIQEPIGFDAWLI